MRCIYFAQKIITEKRRKYKKLTNNLLNAML